uniref:ARAD1D16104p n=1 Tax=Blastobotrys adeninivorans TaxID=409370 RepID=A0A060TFL5_BLAAD
MHGEQVRGWCRHEIPVDLISGRYGRTFQMRLAGFTRPLRLTNVKGIRWYGEGPSQGKDPKGTLESGESKSALKSARQTVPRTVLNSRAKRVGSLITKLRESNSALKSLSNTSETIPGIVSSTETSSASNGSSKTKSEGRARSKSGLKSTNSSPKSGGKPVTKPALKSGKSERSPNASKRGQTSAPKPSWMSEVRREKNILDKIFDDDKIFMSKYATYMRHPYVTSKTPVVTSEGEIKGVRALFVQYAYETVVFPKIPLIYKCDYFVFRYIPPEFFVSLGRKSKPSLLSQFGEGAEYNGVQPKDMKFPPNAFPRSRNPIKWAFMRTRITRDLRHALYRSFESRGEILDGVFVFRSNRYATNKDDLYYHVNKAVDMAYQLLESPKRLKWVNDLNSKTNPAKLNRFLLARNFDPVTFPKPEEKLSIHAYKLDYAQKEGKDT